MLRWPFARTRKHDIETLESQAAYARWADAYPPHPHNPLMRIEQAAVLSLLPDVSGAVVMDAGCGSGRYLHQLMLGGARPVGVDLSPAMLRRAREMTPHLVRADLCSLPMRSSSIDAVVSGLALGDVPDLAGAIGEMARLLRPGGTIVYSVVHPAGADAGWLRTFEADGRQFAVASHWHSEDAHRRACAAAGLTVTAWETPVLPEVSACPTVLVVRASR